ncbi:hypothetical protein Poli38472_000737 [Pythium oligandrum]|uniref:DNA mismatch repair protein n=1 Tax=Pythium oligandrum TaxID=41045 RepID=A0A8K1CDA9_PYTOL|nr:hypothetical protein Poli38472_000737 [Pythium oligandrum]|eukprot:TMW60695.1 hypothetical protein Poli38472_000737 [Pythium oligandrum]
MGPKQQKTLLSFFSPPPRAAGEEKTPASASSNGTSSGPKPATSKSAKPKETDATRKRIEFSPKLKKSETPAKEEEKPTKTPAKRKAHEEFLGTSSEEEEEPVKKSPAKGGFKRLRKSPTKVVEDDEDDEDEEVGPPKRRAKSAAAKSKNVVSSEEEWDPAGGSSEGEKSESDFSGDDMSDEESEDDDEDEEEEEEEEERPAKRRKPAATPTKRKAGGAFLSPPQPNRSPGARKGSVTPPSSTKKSPAASPSATEAVEGSGPNASGVYGAGCHIHDSLPFLNAKRRDVNGNAPDSPEYDPRTLYVPPDFLKKETPAMAQWWQVKAQNMDTVLFFKVGKFYELFHMDADVGFKELNLIYMKGEKAHSGFPEIAYAKMSSQLVEKGYRVARVEQTETPDMLKERNSKSSTKAKVVRREMCSLLSPGTNTVSFLDAPISSSQERISKYLLALKEQVDPQAKSIRYGVVLVDCATGAFHLSEFDDTEQRDRLKTLFAQFFVVEIVNERHGICADTRQVIKHAAPNAIRSELIVGKEFWDASRTIDEITRAGYFNEHGWPEDISQFLNMDKTVPEDAQLVISALGGCVWHLRRSIIDQELMSLCNFRRYKPSDEEAKEQQSAAAVAAEAELNQQYVVLDSQTIQNLEILTNNYNGTRAGSLIDILDKTVTAFGKRLFQEWVLKPLCKVADINERLDAVEELGQNQDAVMEVRDFLRRLPDVERLLSRIHALGSTHRSQEHPDSRAIMYESSQYNIRKIRDFLSVLDGFDAAMDLLQQFGPRFSQFKTPILRTILKKHNLSSNTTDARGHFPDLRDKLDFFKRSFDRQAAAKSGTIVPQDGVDPEYDDACASITRIQSELDDYLREQRTRLKCKQISYWGTKKEDRFQLEIPESALQSSQPKEYELKSRKKGYKRFHSPTIRDLLSQLSAAEDRKEVALKDQMRRIFHKFDEDYKYWMKAVQCLANLDCLLGLALVSSQSEGFIRPEVVSAVQANSGAPFIEIEEGVHPCVASTFDSGGFIPNDTTLGSSGQGRMVLLSGPNMGGKSTLLRQTCVIALMAQIGCFVPASKCRMSPVDRVFTRIGASDRILAGQSTLYVELAETATILNHASRHSLVILDELGRGTSTFDGTAIAYAVVDFLLREVKCRALFATHYHSLVEEYTQDERVSLGHMGCLVDPNNERKVTFLYKLEEGMCPKSYGINVAMLAKLPDEVIDVAAKKSEQFEKSLQANSHVELEALRITRSVEECLASEAVDVKRLRDLWEEAQKLVNV